MVLSILEEHDLDGYISNVVEEPNYNTWRTNFKKNEAKAKQIIYDSMKDYLILVITLWKTAKECFGTLTKLYEEKDPNLNRELRNKL